MPCLPARLAPSDLDDLAADAGDRDSLARSYDFADWRTLAAAVEWRDALSSCNLERIGALLAERPELAVSRLEHWCDHPRGATPVGYIAMLRFDAERLGLPQDIQGTGDVARMLLAAGAPANGDPDDSETTLITAASYGDADVARALIEAGADTDAVAAADAGGVPGGTALLHAGVFGMTDVVDVLVASGARVQGIVEAAAAGDVTGFLTDDTPLDHRVRALTMAAGHDRVEVIAALLAVGTPVDAVDAWGSTALQVATENGWTASAAALLAAGATPS